MRNKKQEGTGNPLFFKPGINLARVTLALVLQREIDCPLNCTQQKTVKECFIASNFGAQCADGGRGKLD
jgi:hypothetical protein